MFRDQYGIIPGILSVLVHVLLFGGLFVVFDFSRPVQPAMPLAIEATLVSEEAAPPPPPPEHRTGARAGTGTGAGTADRRIPEKRSGAGSRRRSGWPISVRNRSAFACNRKRTGGAVSRKRRRDAGGRKRKPSDCAWRRSAGDRRTWSDNAPRTNGSGVKPNRQR